MQTLKDNTSSICPNCQAQLDALISNNLCTEAEVTLLREPTRVINVNFPLLMDDGRIQLISGIRVQYNDALGPTKGGLRMHEECDASEVSELAFLMSLKTALLELPYGGAKGSINVNPKTLSSVEREKAVRGYTKAIAKFIGPDFDIPAPDVNTGPQEMAWIRDEYEKFVGHSAPSSVTGKSIENDGIVGRDISTALGGFHIISAFLSENVNRPSKDIRIAIQGFGNVGRNLAKFLYNAGYTIVAVSNSKVGLLSEKGLNINDLIEYTTKGGALENRTEEKISNEKLLELQVDVLIPSALGNVITYKNVEKISAGVILEMANAPIDPVADAILEQRNIVVIPDILANAGGVVVSYFEWEQNRANEKWDIETVHEQLKARMLKAYDRVFKNAKEENINLRNSAIIIAVKRILENERLRR
jgi:glutamate dehydrogenase/leucine dehydrogenase